MIIQVYWLSQSIFSVFWNVLVAIALLVSSRKLVSQQNSNYLWCLFTLQLFRKMTLQT